MKKYNPQVYTYATSKLNKMIMILRSAKKNPETIPQMCEQYEVPEEQIEKFLDEIVDEYSDMLSDQTSFDKLMFDNVFRRSSLQPLLNAKIYSLQDMSKLPMQDFLKFGLRAATKVKLFNLMIEHNITFSDKTIDEMKQYNEFAMALIN